MAYPESYATFLTSPVFLINLDRCPERLAVSMNRLQSVGFTDIRRVPAVDAKKGAEYLKTEWSNHGSPRLNSYDTEFYSTYLGKQGCMLSHLNVLKYVIDNNIPYFIVFEDDIQLHEKWASLAPLYYEETPKDYDLLYMGAWIEGKCNSTISTNACLCTNAMAMTLEGARRIYKFLLTHPFGAYTIDCMLFNHQCKVLNDSTVPKQFSWYAWNTKHISNTSQKNSGLVYQDDRFQSDVRPT